MRIGVDLGGSKIEIIVLGDDGVIRNTTLLDEEKKNGLKSIQNMVNSYQNKEGKWPSSLQSLVDEGMTPHLPAHPYPGKEWHYDPATGRVD